MYSYSRTAVILVFTLCVFIAVFLNFRKQIDVSTFSIGQHKEKNLDPQDSLLNLGNGSLRYVREKGRVTYLTDLDIDKLSTEELLMTIHSHTDNVNTLCQRKVRMGNIGDGGWEICDDPDVRPRDPCIIYSFGINYDFTFDDDAANVYGCDVYSFDPSMTKEKDQFNRSAKVHFYKLGIDSKTHVGSNKWSLSTFSDIRAKLQHSDRPIDVVKMDVESAEWSTLLQMAESGQLSAIRQFLLEFHVVGADRGYLLPRVKAIQALDRSGFQRFYAHKNPACQTKVSGFPVIRTQCYEVHYLRR